MLRIARSASLRDGAARPYLSWSPHRAYRDEPRRGVQRKSSIVISDPLDRAVQTAPPTIFTSDDAGTEIAIETTGLAAGVYSIGIPYCGTVLHQRFIVR